MHWYGEEFTKNDAVVMFVLTLLYMPMHEFGHWLAYWIFGIPAEFGIMFDPFFAFTTRPLIVPSFNIRMLASFFGGWFVFAVAGITVIKSRPSLIIAVFGLANGIVEVSSVLISEIYGVQIGLLVQSNMMWYLMLQTIPAIVVFAVGFSEIRWWQDQRPTIYA